MRGWWWAWSGCPGIGSSRMAALQAAAVEHGEGLDDCWAWSRERLAQVLSWPDPLLDKVERYRRLHGSSPQLKIPSNVLTPLDQIWLSAFCVTHTSAHVVCSLFTWFYVWHYSSPSDTSPIIPRLTRRSSASIFCICFWALRAIILSCSE